MLVLGAYFTCTLQPAPFNLHRMFMWLQLLAGCEINVLVPIELGFALEQPRAVFKRIPCVVICSQ